MKWQQLNAEPCSIARTLAVIGERWTVLILRECFRDVSRFDQFEKRLGIPRAVLSDRLKQLVEEGILEKRSDPEHARRFDYILTAKGYDLRPVLLTMLEWGDKYKQDGLPPKYIYHHKCAHEVSPKITCSHCDEELRRGEYEIRTRI
ncbi:winged helix-turn-helix transcriptional regulator [Sneathiella glossodoripedis]|uniref:winged helix-turn-helix transcriptional regulator n=1 Tax=Sneathiella glossodoripedis TaxID=418853 RepID=UPI000471EFD5|nr:helix-turn-helix domain-containing protein [Sneathiella glossodoripedis]